MYSKIDLSGTWDFQLDEHKAGVTQPLRDTITLPGTTSFCKKGEKNKLVELGFLTDEYKFEGYAWFSGKVEIPEDLSGKNAFLYLERTRITTLWWDNTEIGTRNSLCTPHVYDITDYLSAGVHTITILVDNTGYPTRGGHLTSPDTQTNWNGITGAIELRFFDKAYMEDVRIYPDVRNRTLDIKAVVRGADHGVLTITAMSYDDTVNYDAGVNCCCNDVNCCKDGIICCNDIKHRAEDRSYKFSSSQISVQYPLGKDALLWSEYEPNLYLLKIDLVLGGVTVDTTCLLTGLREFKASGDKFTINGTKTFLRGKHDGLIFPLTGFAPTTVNEWLRVMKISKLYGINHYRFHTCCPPEAAFTAADILGIYMEPELPFWGTVTDENDPNHNQAEQDYLISEGFSILKAFGNHPSFVMMSLGNELWGSRERLNAILKGFKEFDNRPLYTQGSNNFQFTPAILENEDFFCGVRFSRDRLFRGSYAMCDAPLGHVQTGRPGTMKSYDKQICPYTDTDSDADTDYAGIGTSGSSAADKDVNSAGLIEIQFGTGVKTVEASAAESKLIPHIPVVSHEIGQYATFPDFKEIKKYAGSLKAKNLETFRKRLEEKGLSDLAEKYFQCSGKLAMACYKEELEAAFRSERLAGFQILDIQDFSGQGTALVGVLDAFMDSKGLISAEEWRSFCSDAVLLAKFEKYNYEAGEDFHAHIELCRYKDIPLRDFRLLWELRDGSDVLENGEFTAFNSDNANRINIGNIEICMPDTSVMKKLTLSLQIEGSDTMADAYDINIKSEDIGKTYDLWVYPRNIPLDTTGLNIFDRLSQEAVTLLENGENVLIISKPDSPENAVEGFYCTDFWNYPMFRSISESMNKPVPIGTMGLLINNSHPALRHFPCEEYSTYPWWSIVSNSRSLILDETPREFRPIVQTIDNFERNHKLGLLFECRALNGKLLVCACDMEKLKESPEGRQFLFSILNYASSEEFKPDCLIALPLISRAFSFSC